MYKQVIIIRSDLKMSKGKLAAQCCHASLESYKKSKPTIRKKWEILGQKKIIVCAKNLDELKKLKQKTDKLKLSNVLITDAGRTELKKGTITCLAIGPELSEKINKVSGSLPLVK